MDPRSAIAAIVRYVMRDTTFHRLYRAIVERTNADHTVDVLPEDETIRGIGLQHVPVRVGIAASVVSAEPGLLCLLGFEGGDPQRPYIAAWEYRQRSAIVKLDGGDAAVARKGDAIRVLTVPAMAVSGVCGGTVDTPNASPPPPTVPVPVVPGTPFVGVVTIATPVTATPIGGARKVLA